MKRTYMKIIIAFVLGASLFTGCASSATAVKVGGASAKKVKVSKSGNVYTFKTIKRVDQYVDNGLTYREAYKAAFSDAYDSAASYGRQNGFKYMAMVNEGLNNLSGFPLNTKASMLSYFDLYKKAHFKIKRKGIESPYRQIEFKVVYFKDKLPGIFLFKL